MAEFEIHDKSQQGRLLGYLFYYEASKRFFTELMADTDEWTCPFLFSGFVKKGIYSIDSEWSGKFVSQRVIPPDRQNLGSVLKENGLKEYDEYKLLLLSEGRCAQDELYLVRISEKDISEEIQKRLTQKVLDVMALKKNRVAVFFKDGKSVSVDIEKLCKDDRLYLNILSNEEIFRRVSVSPGGNGIEWGREHFISAEILRKTGRELGMSYEDLKGFISDRLADTAEASQMLNCSRQYIKQLTDKEKITPVRKGANNNIYLKGQIEREE